MSIEFRRCTSCTDDNRDLKGWELAIDIGPFGFQLFIGKVR